ncbi:MAG: hypothetical protein EORIYHIE_002094 [Candidatus Fervidibacter sp.]
MLSLAMAAKFSPNELSCRRAGQGKGFRGQDGITSVYPSTNEAVEAAISKSAAVTATPFAHHCPNRRLAWGRREILRFSANSANPTLRHR